MPWEIIVADWRSALTRILQAYEAKKRGQRYFWAKLFALFVLINLVSYWVAMLTAFPHLVFGPPFWHYFKMQFPVGIFSAAFEMLSFHVTVILVRHAVRTTTVRSYLSHLGFDMTMDAVIGVLATLWTVYSFSTAGWLVDMYDHWVEGAPLLATYETPETASRVLSASEAMRDKGRAYSAMLVGAVRSPYQNWRNLYFGMIMGLSEMLPMALYTYLGWKAWRRSLRTHNTTPAPSAQRKAG